MSVIGRLYNLEVDNSKVAECHFPSRWLQVSLMTSRDSECLSFRVSAMDPSAVLTMMY